MALFSVRRWLREPAAHFTLLGFGLFVLHGLVQRPRSHPGEQVIVSAAFVDGLSREQAERTGKPPTPEEERALVDRFVDEELLYREALALGLDRGDLIVRRRLIQKMELVGAGAAPLPEPSDAELTGFLEAHADRYREPATLTFHHVFLSRDRRGERASDDARRLSAELRAGADPLRAGDPFFQGREWSHRSGPEIAAVFGPAFTEALAALPIEAWSEPISSSYGEHLVWVSERSPGRPAPLSAVRARVREEWMTERREQSRHNTMSRLRERYRVEVEPRPSGAPQLAQGLAR
jgi:hypothetical protein